MQITQAMIGYWAPTPEALKRSRAIRFLELHTYEQTLWGRPLGSGAEPYATLADFTQSPLFRCTCPSRQTPCKHALALMQAYLDAPIDFSPATPPLELSLAPQTVRRTASRALGTMSTKKNALRRLGLERARAILVRLAEEGLANLTPASAGDLRHDALELARYGISAISDRLYELLSIDTDPFSTQKEQDISFLPKSERHDKSFEAAQEMARLFALCERGLMYLSDPESFNPELETLLGRVWRLDELSALGHVRRDVCLLQLAFTVTDRPARRRQEELGVWADPDSGTLYLTQSVRPYAAGHLRMEDSRFDAVQIEELYTYPGILRARWKRCTPVEATPELFQKLCQNAEPSLEAALGRVIPQLQDRFLQREPYSLLRFSTIGKNAGELYLRDDLGQTLPLQDGDFPSLRVLESVFSGDWRTILLRITVRNGRPSAIPLCLISEERALRLTP